VTSDTFDDLRDLYQEVILDHGRRPRHARRLEDFDATAKGDNPMCGDRIEVWVKYAPDGLRRSDCRDSHRPQQGRHARAVRRIP
jgi:hypothetical protein